MITIDHTIPEQFTKHFLFPFYPASAEMKKKLYGSVLLIGGGLSFSHASLLLQSRLESSLPAQFSKGSDTVEVSSNPRVR